MAVFLVLLVALIAMCGFLGFGFGTLGRGGARLRGWAGVAAGVTCAWYAWGMLAVGGAVLDAEDGGTGSAPIRPCVGGSPESALVAVTYRVDYLPVRFVCEVQHGGDYATDDVPGYVNPALAVGAFATVVLGAGAAIGSERAARRTTAPTERV
ncbi:hypothetical protein G3I40_33450 [Streptomyces sp. SID14478]|uniref:hypothetical protein n=1 Tax=Streptomyces sp. SID14478 TaxID=2706073 RepID=UPI0013DC1119|nr:hypothetical protein [Streptomyces sp. SID14478]NEB80080.1 hypothetical protein [Streptomyces sp. SID14478]